MMRPAPRAAPAGAPTLNGGAKRGGGAAAALPAPLARLHVFVALAAAVVAATALPSARRSCGIVDRTATHCPAGAAAALLLAGWGATAYALAAPAYLLAAALAALPRPPAAAAWLPAAAEAPLFAAALLDAAAWAKTGLHLPDFDQSLALLWASLKGIRGRFLAAVAAALLAGAALSWAAGRLAGGLAAAAARRGAKGGGAGAWPPRPRALRPLGVAAAALLALAAVGSLRARALACGAPPLAEAAAWNSLPIHLAVGAAPECGGTGTSGGGGAAALDARASLAAAQRCAAPPRAGGAPRAARAELAVALDPAVSARPDAAARAPRSAVLIFVDSLPAREFVSTVPAGTKRTSERFRREVSSLFPESRGCRLLDNHFAASSYTSDGLYASLHGFLPFAYAPQDPPWCVPVDALRQAGYETGIFMAGPIGSDYCGAYWTDGGCTKRFETLKVLGKDTLVVDEALAWAQSRDPSRPFLLTLYLEGPHMAYGSMRVDEFETLTLAALRLVDKVMQFASARNDTLVLVTADHGCAAQAGDGDCDEKCGTHGLGTFGAHATDQVSHVPLWACAASAAGEALVKAAAALPLTSNVDIMPTLLDWVALDPMPPAHLWSGASWLSKEAAARRYVASVSRLKCKMDVALIDKESINYIQRDIKCLKASDACVRSGAVVPRPSWARDGTRRKVKVAAGIAAAPKAHLHGRLLPATLNRARLPRHSAPGAFMLCMPCESRLRLCLNAANHTYFGTVAYSFEPYPDTFDKHDDMLGFLWAPRAGGAVSLVLNRGIGLAGAVEPKGRGRVLALPDGRVLAACVDAPSNRHNTRIVVSASADPRAAEKCYALSVEQPWLQLPQE